jgi:hypothetical protein
MGRLIGGPLSPLLCSMALALASNWGLKAGNRADPAQGPGPTGSHRLQGNNRDIGIGTPAVRGACRSNRRPLQGANSFLQSAAAAQAHRPCLRQGDGSAVDQSGSLGGRQTADRPENFVFEARQRTAQAGSLHTSCRCLNSPNSEKASLNSATANKQAAGDRSVSLNVPGVQNCGLRLAGLRPG